MKHAFGKAEDEVADRFSKGTLSLAAMRQEDVAAARDIAAARTRTAAAAGSGVAAGEAAAAGEVVVVGDAAVAGELVAAPAVSPGCLSAANSGHHILR
jgi:hypothetical protein